MTTEPDPPPITIEHVVNVLEGTRHPTATSSDDTEPPDLADLPDCEHCGGTGKNLAGTPWDDQR